MISAVLSDVPFMSVDNDCEVHGIFVVTPRKLQGQTGAASKLDNSPGIQSIHLREFASSTGRSGSVPKSPG